MEAVLLFAQNNERIDDYTHRNFKNVFSMPYQLHTHSLETIAHVPESQAYGCRELLELLYGGCPGAVVPIHSKDCTPGAGFSQGILSVPFKLLLII